jgi:hypothetical protein
MELSDPGSLFQRCLRYEGRGIGNGRPNRRSWSFHIRTASIAKGVQITWDTGKGFDVDIYGASYGDLSAGDRVVNAVETWATVDGQLCAGLLGVGQGAVVGGVIRLLSAGCKSSLSTAA